jgi:hypothetical protein
MYRPPAVDAAVTPGPDDRGRFALDPETTIAAAFVTAMEQAATEQGLTATPKPDTQELLAEQFAEWLQNLTQPEGDTA